MENINESDVIARVRNTSDCREPDPKCPSPRGWAFRSPYELVGGNEENPGVFGVGGTAIRYTEVCRNTGVWRITYCPNDLDDPDDPEIQTYLQPDQESLEWVREQRCARQ